MMLGLVHDNDLASAAPVLWMDARRTGALGTLVSALPQRGSAPATITQGVGAKQPVVSSTFFTTRVTFDSTDDCLVVGSIDLTTTQVVSMALAMQQVASNAGGSVLYEISTDSTTQDGGAAVFRGNLGAFNREIGAIDRGNVGTNFQTTSPTILNSGAHVVTTTQDFTQPAAAELSMWVDEAAMALTTTLAGPSNNTGFFKNLPSYLGSRNNGASKPMGGSLFQVLLFARSLSATQKASLTAGMQKILGTGNQDFRVALQTRMANALITLPAPTVVVGAGQVNQSATINIPWPCIFDRQTYTQVTVSSNGFVCFGNPATVPTNKTSWGAAASPPLCAVWWDNLKTADATGYVRWSYSGTAPSRTLQIEWMCYGNAVQTAADNDTIRFQWTVSEQGTFSLRYAPYTTTGNPDRSGYGAAIGFQGSSAGTTARYWNMLPPNGGPLTPTASNSYSYAATMDAASTPRLDLIVRNVAGNLDWPGTAGNRSGVSFGTYYMRFNLRGA